MWPSTKFWRFYTKSAANPTINKDKFLNHAWIPTSLTCNKTKWMSALKTPSSKMYNSKTNLTTCLIVTTSAVALNNNLRPWHSTQIISIMKLNYSHFWRTAVHNKIHSNNNKIKLMGLTKCWWSNWVTSWINNNKLNKKWKVNKIQ